MLNEGHRSRGACLEPVAFDGLRLNETLNVEYYRSAHGGRQIEASPCPEEGDKLQQVYPEEKKHHRDTSIMRNVYQHRGTPIVACNARGQSLGDHGHHGQLTSVGR